MKQEGILDQDEVDRLKKKLIKQLVQGIQRTSSAPPARRRAAHTLSQRAHA